MNKRVDDTIASNGSHRVAIACEEPERCAALSSTGVVAERVVELLTRIDKLDRGRVLLIDIASDALVAGLRELGFNGDVCALRGDSSPLDGTADDMADVMATTATESSTARTGVRQLAFDWRRVASGTQVDSPTPISGECFEVIVLRDGLDPAHEANRSRHLEWLTSLLAPRGFIIFADRLSGSAAPVGRQAALEQLGAIGLFPVTDEALVRDDGQTQGATPRVLVAAQNRGIAECRQSGALRRVTLADLDADPTLRSNLVAAYRDVFGGEEWREWMRCQSPSCGRQYSRGEAAALERQGWCECGAPLEPFHPPASVAAMLRAELADHETSRCYVQQGSDGCVEGFIWGYITTPDQLVDILIGSEHTPTRARLLTHLQQLLQNTQLSNRRIYYQAQVGVAEGMRSFSALRALFQRVVQFASDSGVEVVITRTHLRVAGYSLLRGLGMQIIYRYDDPANQTQREQTRSTLHTPADHRVVFGGALDPILTQLVAESDRGIQLHIAHRLRALQTSAATNSVEPGIDPVPVASDGRRETESEA